ncbi:MAG: methylmalonyl Co-A mutase-associated GTPase MeaB [Chloroflexi bacterium]|nr:methylmalonyl Co-A mutase-associated GTPase MeaB [Chloroflexota bacterium]
MESYPRDLAAQVLQGERRAIARILSLVEDGQPPAREVLANLYSHTGKAHLIGVTGPPGAGKSTLLLGLAKEFRARGKKVGIVAVDPSSPLSGGALLGDRIRMQELTADGGVFIRSMAARGHLGGLALATSDAVKILDAAGYEIIFIETVGAGQAEVEIASEAHTTMVVEAPGLGDEIQALKSGILEVGDIFVVNKSDREGAEATLSALRFMLKTEENRPSSKWQPPLIKAVATKGEGVLEIADALQKHLAYLKESGEWEERNRMRSEQEVMRILGAELLSRLRGRLEGESWAAILSQVAERKLDPYRAAEELLAELPLPSE